MISQKHNPPVLVVGSKDVNNMLKIQGFGPITVDSQEVQVAVPIFSASVPQIVLHPSETTEAALT